MNLRHTRPMMNGPEVRRLQEDLEELGYDVGAKGVDSWFGRDTQAAVMEFQEENGLPVDGIVGADTWEVIEALLVDGLITSKPDQPGTVSIVGQHPHPKLFSRSRSPRSIINGVTLHQTGVLCTDTPERFKSLNAHIVILRCGDVVIVNDPLDFIWHAQTASHHTIGIEFNGLFAGTPQYSAPQKLTQSMLDGAEKLFSWLQNWFKQNSMKWEYLYAHRQFKDSRRADPGYEIWQQVALPWIKKLGLSDGGPKYTQGTGKAIPSEWNPEYSNKY